MIRPWYRLRPLYFEAERESVRELQPLMALDVCSKSFPVGLRWQLPMECAVCSGMFQLRVPGMPRSLDYSIAIVLQPDHPQTHPLMFSNDPRMPAGRLDRHIVDTGQACLGVSAELRRKWTAQDGIGGFFRKFVEPFIYWQAFYDAHGVPPPEGERSHGARGILEFYSEELGVSNQEEIPGLMTLLGQRKPPKGHIPCPCGSGLKLRNCHGDLIWKAHGKLNPDDVLADLKVVNSGRGSK